MSHTDSQTFRRSDRLRQRISCISPGPCQSTPVGSSTPHGFLNQRSEQTPVGSDTPHGFVNQRSEQTPVGSDTPHGFANQLSGQTPVGSDTPHGLFNGRCEPTPVGSDTHSGRRVRSRFGSHGGHVGTTGPFLQTPTDTQHSEGRIHDIVPQHEPLKWCACKNQCHRKVPHPLGVERRDRMQGLSNKDRYIRCYHELEAQVTLNDKGNKQLKKIM